MRYLDPPGIASSGGQFGPACLGTSRQLFEFFTKFASFQISVEDPETSSLHGRRKCVKQLPCGLSFDLFGPFFYILLSSRQDPETSSFKHLL